MTPPDATTHTRATRATHGGGTRRRAPSRPSRRVSGPAGGVRAARLPLPAAAGAGTAAAPPLALRLARAGARVGDARLLDRLVRGRGWIVLVAAGLMGIVFMQVSMLRLNAGISRAVTSAETLERQNSMLRADISKLDAGERIQDTATALGMVRPPAGGVNYLDARKADGRAAARAIRKPNPVKVEAPATTEGAQAQAAAVPPATAQGAAPAQGQPQTQPPAATSATPQPQPQTATPQAQPQTATQPPTATQAQPQAPTQPQPEAPAQPQPQAPAQTTTQAATATPIAQPQVQQPAATTAGGPAAGEGAQ